MTRRLHVLAAVLIAFAAAIPVGAQNQRTIIPVGSVLYTYLDNLYMEAGKAPVFSARPWTAGEFVKAVEQIQKDSLSESGIKLLKFVLETVTNPDVVFKESNFSFNSEPSITAEVFYHAPISDSTESVPEAYQWAHGYEERRPFLNIPLEFWYGDSLYMVSEIQGKEEYRTVTSPATPDVAANYTNILFDDPNVRLDLYFPFRASLATGGDWWTFLFGRDTLSWGDGSSGNLMLSDFSDFYDFVSLSFFSPSFRLTSVYSVLDRFLPDGTDISYAGFMGHRLEMRFFDRVFFAISESVTFANLRPELIRDLNFLMVFHNWTAPERMNSLMTFELAVNPWKYINIYAHFAMDEFTTKYEEDRDGGGGPPIYGFLAGLSATYPLGPGYLDGTLEFAQTSPWLYNRRSPPYYYNVRRYWSLVTDRMEYITKPLGYEYGADSLVLHGTASYRVPGLFSANLVVERISTGEKEAGTPWDPAPGDVSPSGIPETRWIAKVGGEWTINRYVDLGGAIYWSNTQNPSHLAGEKKSDLELTAFVRLSL